MSRWPWAEHAGRRDTARFDTERKPGQPQAQFKDDEANARGSCEDVARAVLAFANPKDSYVTGQTVHVSGGRYMA